MSPSISAFRACCDPAPLAAAILFSARDTSPTVRARGGTSKRCRDRKYCAASPRSPVRLR